MYLWWSKTKDYNFDGTGLEWKETLLWATQNTKACRDLNPVWPDPLLFMVLPSSHLWFSVCASKGGIRCCSQRWLHRVPAALGLALMAAALPPPFGTLQLPGEGDSSTTPARELWGECSPGVIQLVSSSQKHRLREIGTIHSSLQHFCLLSAPHTKPPGALREVDTASVHNAPFTVKHAAVTPQHLQNLLKEADKHSRATG